MQIKQKSPRQLKVGEQIKHILAAVLQRNEIQDPLLQKTIITITQVVMSADLKLAKCYFTVLGGTNYQPVQEALHRNGRYIRGLCSKELRNLKYMPKFYFYYDDSFDNFSKIDKILKSIKTDN